MVSMSVIPATEIIVKTLQVTGIGRVLELNVSSLIKGVYTIKMTCGDKVTYRQFVKL